MEVFASNQEIPLTKQWYSMRRKALRMDWQERLVTLFLYISKSYELELCIHVSRMSNNSEPKFSDSEVLTVSLWEIMNGHSKISRIYEYVQNHFPEWFPKLPAYKTYVQPLNRLPPTSPVLLS